MGNEKKMAKARVLQAENKLVLVKAYKEVFKGAAGKIVLQDLSKECYLVTPTFTDGDKPLELALKEGKRHVICNILAMLEKSTIDIIGLIKDTNKQMDNVHRNMDIINTTDNDEIFGGGSDA